MKHRTPRSRHTAVERESAPSRLVGISGHVIGVVLIFAPLRTAAVITTVVDYISILGRQGSRARSTTSIETHITRDDSRYVCIEHCCVNVTC